MNTNCLFVSSDYLLCIARPVFLNNSFRPHDMNVTEGETVTIKCDPYAIPDATINWYKNGVAFTGKFHSKLISFTETGCSWPTHILRPITVQ